jgi:hypothetical protein
MKPHAAFGYVLIENTYADGETWKSIINDDIQCKTFWVKGLFKNKQLSLGSEDFQDLKAGRFLKPADYIQCVFEHTSVGESKVFCFDPRLNNNQSVELTPFLLKSGEQTVLSKGTKLFFCYGNLSLNGKNIVQPTQISIQSNDVLVIANNDCYGLLF